MKNGFSTLNRLLGKKSKSNTNLSKSTTNLSVASSTTNIDDSSQMQQNRITPLPVAASNAPFEQTFRITVLLPKDQLYVARLGARVPLEKLLELVCENKQLDPDKYEFRDPVYPSQVFSCDLTIGAVGLSEIRLCHKSESYDTFNAEEIKLHRTTAGRDSVSSSEFSSRNSKHATKTPSLYSSSNSLNSTDSTGMNSAYRHHHSSTPKGFAQPAVPPVAPTRKKRLAPRPPSQNSIPEKAVSPPLPNTKPPSPTEIKPSSELNGIEPIPRKDFHVSSPNLSQPAELHVLSNKDFHKSNLSVDCNGNTKGSPDNNGSIIQNGNHSQENGGIGLTRPTSLHILNQDDTEASNNCNGEVAVKNARNSYNSVQNLSTIGTPSPTLPEPSPRKKGVVKTKKAAPAPPARFLQSPTETISETPQTPDEDTAQSTMQLPRPVALPRSSTGRTTPEPEPADLAVNNSQNVSKTLLNRSPTPDPCTPTDLTTSITDDGFDSQSKQADSGIGEALPPSPLPSSAQNSPTQCKSPFESSSDDDEMIKVYNLKLGKTIVKNLSEHKTFEDLTVLSTDESEVTSQARKPAETISIQSETTTWSNFTIPAPPNFADTSGDDTPITPIIKERPPLDFMSLSVEQTIVSPLDSPEPPAEKTVDEKKLSNSDIEDGLKLPKETELISKVITEVDAIKKDDSAVKPSEVITVTETVVRDKFEPKDPNEPSVVVEKRSVITKHQPSITDPDGIGEQEAKALSEIDSVINSIETNIHQKPLISTLERLGVSEEDDIEDEIKETKIYKKRSSITLNTNVLKQRRSVNRSDSFHSTRQQQIEETAKVTENGVVTRSSSFLSLAKFGSENQQSPPAEVNLNRRRSSSELSIGESPSLQSVEVMKSILNSRKNSVTSQSSTEDANSNAKPPLAPVCDSQHSTEKSSSPKSKLLRTQISKTTEEKVYRYSGPPSINFSTWNERPKVQVSIKNEGDYIFGGKIGGPSATTTATVNLMQQKNFRNSTPDPMVVNRVPYVKSVEYKKSTSVMSPLSEANSRYSVAKTPTTPPPTPSSPTTMPKPKFILGGRMSNPSPVVRGFAQLSAQHANSSTLPRSHGPSSVSILRSTSVTQADVKPKPESTEPPQPLFGQGTLRKTGLKEKILADQENDSPKSTPTVLTSPQSAKIELKITKTYVPEKTPSQATPTKLSATTTTPPPPPPIIRAVVTKQNSNGPPTSLSLDPRDQLLSAIRNFKRDDLKRT